MAHRNKNAASRKQTTQRGKYFLAIKTARTTKEDITTMKQEQHVVGENSKE